MNHLLPLATICLCHKVFAEPIRLRILNLLSQRESLCVCDLVTVLETTQSTTSRHLAYLKNHGLVTTWREGNWIHYAICAESECITLLEKTLNHDQGIAEFHQDLERLLSYETQPRQCSTNAN